MSSEEGLGSLTVSKLMEICKIEGLEDIPKKIKKQELIKTMMEKIPDNKLEKYLKETTNPEKNKHKVTGSAQKEGDNYVREKVIVELQKHRIHRILLNELAENLGEKPPAGKGIQLFDGMSDRMLKELEKIFLKPNEEESERTFTMICSNWLIFKAKEIESIKTGYQIDDKNRVDVIAYDVGNLPYIMAECSLGKNFDGESLNMSIDKATKILDIHGKKIAKRYREAWLRIYFFGDEQSSSRLLELIRKNGKIDQYGEMHIKRGLFKTDYNLKFHVYSVNDGKFHGLLF